MAALEYFLESIHGYVGAIVRAWQTRSRGQVTVVKFLNGREIHFLPGQPVVVPAPDDIEDTSLELAVLLQVAVATYQPRQGPSQLILDADCAKLEDMAMSGAHDPYGHWDTADAYPLPG